MPNLDSKITTVPRVNAKYADALGRLNIRTIRDLLFHFPFRYEDYNERVPIDNLEKDMTATIMGTVISSKLSRTWKKKIMIVEAHIQDESGSVRAVWFNQPYISDQLVEGRAVRLSGKVSEDSKGIYFSNPAWERSSREPTNTGRLVPIYPETEGITSRWLRWQIQGIIKLAEEIEEPIPQDILKNLHLPDLQQCLRWIHFPENEKQYLIAQKRFAFQDMLLMQLASLRARSAWEKEKAVSIKFDEKLIKNFVDSLPFVLTNAQKKAAFQIFQDMEKSRPMNRLLNGDVGSGKTVVAALAALSCANGKYQTALMAPTEVLARQHFESISKLFSGKNITIALLTNSYQLINGNSKLKIKNFKQNPNELITKLTRIDLLENIKSGNIDIIIGTHALIQKDVKFKNLALVVVDEQHRFGVQQRAALQRAVRTDADLMQTDTELLYEEITSKIRGAIFNVKKELGLGHKEAIYQKALAEEFKKNGLAFDKEKSIDIKYNSKKIGIYRPDFVVENSVILELKALPFVGKFEKQQVWHYLKGSNYKIALLINFGRDDVKIERFIFDIKRESASSLRPVRVCPHLLSMTATPIPRTLTLAFFGDLDLSVLDEMPKNRKPIITKIVLPSKRENTYDFVRSEITKGRQAFFIFPLVEESSKLTELKAATQEHERLSRDIFPQLKLGLLHGKLKAKEKERVMQDFKDKNYDILVATSVVEVGIDVPNTSVIMIEDADRFGLSQLHQFRGRVGRSEHQSYCFLLAGKGKSSNNARLKALEKNNDGFAIAEEDLKLRGPGQFFGTQQSGLPDIAMQHIANVKLIELSRKYAEEILQKDPALKRHALLKKDLEHFATNVHME